MYHGVMKYVSRYALCAWILLGAAQEEIAQESCDALAAPDAREINSRLHRAVLSGDCEVVRNVLKLGVDIDASSCDQNKTALHFAAQQGHVAIVRILLSHGCQVDIPDAVGWTPLWWACFSGKFDVFVALAEAGALLNIPLEEVVPLMSYKAVARWRHKLMVLLAACWIEGIHVFLEEIAAVEQCKRGSIIYSEGQMAVRDRKIMYYQTSVIFLKESIQRHNLIILLPKVLTQLIISFVADKKDLNAAMRFLHAEGEGENVVFLQTIGAGNVL